MKKEHFLRRKMAALALGVGLLASTAASVSSFATEQGQYSVKARGLVVETMPRGGSLAKAGIQPRDTLLSWSSAESSGDLFSVFQWWALVHGSAMVSEVQLAGLRQGEPFSVRVPKGDWAGTVNPVLPEALERAYNVASNLPACHGQPGSAAWDTLFQEQSSLQGDVSDLIIWLVLQREASVARCPEGPSDLSRLQTFASDLRHPREKAAFWSILGEAYLSASQAEPAIEALQQARGQGSPKDSPQSPIVTHLLSKALLRNNQIEAAGLEGKEALSQVEASAPGSLLQARALWLVGRIDEVQGNFVEGVHGFEQSLKILEALQVTPSEITRTWRNLGITRAQQGHLQEAQRDLERALEWAKKIEGPTVLLGSVFNNLGLVAYNRGDMDTAQRYLLEAHKSKVANAETLPVEPSTLVNLGIIAVERQDYAAAAPFFEAARADLLQLDPNSLGMATVLNNLGRLRRLQGNLSEARKFHEEALEIQSDIAPTGLPISESLERLAQVNEEAGDLAAAAESYRKAQNLREKLAPSSPRNGILLYRMAALARHRGKNAMASDLFARAVALVEERMGDLGGSHEQRQFYRSMYGSVFREYVEVLYDQGDIEKAFEVQERSRARIFREMLAERDLDLGRSLPEAWDRERETLASRYDQVLMRTAALDNSGDESEALRLAQELTELRWQRDELLEKGRQHSPRLAALQYPRALLSEEVRAALDPGTLLLAFSVDEQSSLIFALSKDAGVEARRLDLSKTNLQAEVDNLLSLIQQGAVQESRRAGLRATSLKVASQRLFERLLKPFEERIERAERLLLLPDGPLYRLPFGALVRELPVESDTERSWQYVVEWKPIHFALSASLYSELRQVSTKAPKQWSLVAFGAPKTYASLPAGGGESSRNQDSLAAVRQGLELRELPGARREVQRITAQFPGSRSFLGDEVTEERVLALPQRVDLLHFATHVRLDEDFPLDSALVLSIPEPGQEGRANGLLQVWEIFENLRVEAEVVVLSGCESGLGKEVQGEGLMSLTRAFHFAGAKSVLASLWPVADGATAELMTRFYHHLRSGLAKDQALRSAQLELIDGERGAGIASPYYWAAFQLSGDWSGGR